MDIDLEQEKKDLIKEIITSDKRYVGNEDLYDKFFEETCKRGLIVLKTLDGTDAVRVYLNKIVSAALVQVLEDNKRLNSVFEEEPEVPDNEYAKVKVEFNFDYEAGLPEVSIKKDVLQKLYDSVTVFNSEHPQKEYLQIYNLRYIKGQTLNQIADALNIDKEEVAKRLFEIMEKVKGSLE